MSGNLSYKIGMAKKRGRPPTSGGPKGDKIEVRMTDAEKQAFQSAADLSGLSLSSWVRERLRRVARAELTEAGKPVAFMGDGTPAPPKPIGGT